MVRVLPDVPALDRTFDYLLPEALGEAPVGSLVRVALGPRRVRGWVLEHGVTAPAGLTLSPVLAVVSVGPAPELCELAAWAAWRWAGRRAHLLRAASAPKVVRRLPRRAARPAPETAGLDPLAARALAVAGPSVVRLAPAADPFPLVLAAAAQGPALVLTPSALAARRLAGRLHRHSVDVALHPQDWARAAAGVEVVVGARAAAWAPAPGLAAVVVLDEHDEAYQEQRSPTWHARDVALERARRAGVPALLVSPTPSLEALDAGPLFCLERAAERRGWPLLEVVDRRGEDPARGGLYTSRLVERLRAVRAEPDGLAVCVLNRTGRARLLACRSCGELARCERCTAALRQDAPGGELLCARCGEARPAVCAACGALAHKTLRVGVGRAREELEALVGAPVVELTSASPPEVVPSSGVVVGTEAALHRVERARLVAFLDIDQELLAARHRAAEQAMGLLARAARLAGRRDGPGRLLVQTRLPDHDVLEAVRHADPGRAADAERARRRALGWPPYSALALLSGPGGAELAAALAAVLHDQPGAAVLGPAEDRWLVRAASHAELCDALAAAPRPRGRVRIEVDPQRA